MLTAHMLALLNYHSIMALCFPIALGIANGIEMPIRNTELRQMPIAALT